MTPSHPCAGCGAPLQWIGPYGAWWCPRCQRYAGTAAPTSQVRRPWVPYAIAGAVGIALIAVLAAVLGGGDGDGGGRGGAGGGAPRDPDDLVRRLVRALDRGDTHAVEDLVMDTRRYADAIECKDGSEQSMRDMMADYEREQRRKLRDRVARWVDREPVVISVTETKREDHRDGEEAFGECRWAVGWAEVDVEVTLRYLGDSGSTELHTAKVELVELDGRWWLLDVSNDPWGA